MEAHEFRELFLLDPEITFLNHGSFGATPRVVFESYQRWQRELEKQPVKFLGREIHELLLFARKALAGFIHTDFDDIVFIPNATTGVNILARSINLQPGEGLLTTNQEYGACARTWNFLSRQSGFSICQVKLSTPFYSKDDLITEICSSFSPTVKAIFISHISSTTSVIFPIKEICLRAREAGILTIIDGAHAPGQVDLNIEEIGCDFYIGNLHKWLCAPKGSAFLYARKEIQPLVQPFIVSWGWESENPSHSQFIDYLEWTGTNDMSAFLAVPDAIQFQRTYEWEKVRYRCHELASATRHQIELLSGRPGLYPDSSDWYSQMVSVRLPDEVETLLLKNTLYDNYSIEVPILDWEGMKLIRISIQAYNSPTDVEKLINALKEILNFNITLER